MFVWRHQIVIEYERLTAVLLILEGANFATGIFFQ